MSAPAITEADILNEVVAPDRPGLTEAAARSVLSLHFSESARERIRQLQNEALVKLREKMEELDTVEVAA